MAKSIAMWSRMGKPMISQKCCTGFYRSLRRTHAQTCRWLSSSVNRQLVIVLRRSGSARSLQHNKRIDSDMTHTRCVPRVPSCPPSGWSSARVRVGMLRGGGDSKIIQDLLIYKILIPYSRFIKFPFQNYPRLMKIPSYWSHIQDSISRLSKLH